MVKSRVLLSLAEVSVLLLKQPHTEQDRMPSQPSQNPQQSNLPVWNGETVASFENELSVEILTPRP